MNNPVSIDMTMAQLLAAPRVPLADLDRGALPVSPGIFLLFRETQLVHIGVSAGLPTTLAQLFATQGPASLSPLRRSVAGYLGLASAREIAAARYRPTAADHARISEWLRRCSIVCSSCANEAEVLRLETRLRHEREASPGR